jgi:hypothetical protein
MRQLGNAVPVQLGRVVADSVYSQLRDAQPLQWMRDPPATTRSTALI